jgi:hypothetical protein
MFRLPEPIIPRSSAAASSAKVHHRQRDRLRPFDRADRRDQGKVLLFALKGDGLNFIRRPTTSGC